MELDQLIDHNNIGDPSVCDVFVFFFFQAEDGIRDLTVTGVQTCALPIFSQPHASTLAAAGKFPVKKLVSTSTEVMTPGAPSRTMTQSWPGDRRRRVSQQIGRASCRERV